MRLSYLWQEEITMTGNRLKNPFIRVLEENRYYYGGNQHWCKSRNLSKYGCGVVSVANVVLYNKAIANGSLRIKKANYVKLIRKLSRWYIRPLPKFGVNGWYLAFGFNLYSLLHKQKMIGFWGCSSKKIWARANKMLGENIPVILAIGPNNIWKIKKKNLNLYEKRDGKYVKVDSCRGHFVTITAIDKTYLTVSSWGRKLYINKNEFVEYVNKNSNWLFSNILVVKVLKNKKNF